MVRPRGDLQVNLILYLLFGPGHRLINDNAVQGLLRAARAAARGARALLSLSGTRVVESGREGEGRKI